MKERRYLILPDEDHPLFESSAIRVNLTAMFIQTTTIDQTEWIPAKPMQVYDAWMNASKGANFIGAEATCHRTAGGYPRACALQQ